MWKNQANKDDEVEAEKEDTDENKDQKFDTDNVALEDNEEYFEVQECDAVVMKEDTLGEKEMNYSERSEAVNDNDVEDQGMVDGSETKDNSASTVETSATQYLLCRDLHLLWQALHLLW